MPVAQLDGADMYYESIGTGKPVVLIMGLGGNVDWWGMGFRKRLARRQQVIAFDNRGAGRTKDDGKPLSIEQMALDVAALLDSVDCNKAADVIGFSMGGMIAQELSLTHPHLVDNLVLGATSAGGTSAVMPTPYAMQLLLGMQSVDSATSAIDSQMKLLFPESFIKSHTTLWESLSKTLFRNPMTRENFQRQLQAVLTWRGTCDRLHDVSQSALILHGTEDIMIPPENGQILADEMARAKLTFYEGCGHGFAVQEPERVMSDIELFLESDIS